MRTFARGPELRRKGAVPRRCAYPSRCYPRVRDRRSEIRSILGGSRFGRQDFAAGGPARSVAGRDAPIPLRPLTPEDRLVDLQSARFRGDPDLEAAFDNNPPISWGGPREAVKKLQLAFQDLGFLLPRSIDPDTGEADGIFGLETYRVVRGFQLQQGIVRDGIVGRQTMGELDGLFSGQTPPGSRPAGPDQPGAPLTVADRDVTPKKFGTCGGFLWTIDWETNARNGYLVQEITKEFEISPCGGIAPEPAFTGHYFEAWRVQADGGIHGSSGPDDNWINPSLDITDLLGGFPGTSGRWKTEGKVFFVPQLDPGAGFKLFRVPDAQGLWSTTERPGNLGTALLVRQAGDKWSCCDTETPK